MPYQLAPIFQILIILVGFSLAAYLTLTSLKGIENKRISVFVRIFGPFYLKNKVTGKPATRISFYYLTIAIILLLVLINQIIKISITTDPFTINLSQTCLIGCA